LNNTNPTVSKAKEMIKNSISETYLQLQPVLQLNKIELEKAVDKTTTNLINNILINTNYEAVNDTAGFAFFKNKIVEENLKALQQIELPENKKEKEEIVEKICVKIDSKEIVQHKIALRYNYTYASLVFMIFGILALVVGFMLKDEDRKKGYELELPNIKK